MNNNQIKDIVYKSFGKQPDKIERFETGLANFVYKVKIEDKFYVVRISGNDEFNSTYWIEKLSHLNIQIPRIKYRGELNGYKYMIMDFIEGDDLGNVYQTLSEYQKKQIAFEIAKIQTEVAKLPLGNGFGCVGSYEDVAFKKSWKEVILSDLERTREWMGDKDIFDKSKVDEVEDLLNSYDDYFDKIVPVPFLDDITTKNVLIHKGNLSGIIDLDWICFGDYLYFIALTNMSLLSMKVDTQYITYLKEAFKTNDFQNEIIDLYTLVFCVIFMSEIGMNFNKSEPSEIDTDKVNNLNNLYDELHK